MQKYFFRYTLLLKWWGVPENQSRKKIKMSINSNHKYQLIQLDLESRINCGDLSDTDFLPAEQELAAYYCAGRNTIRRVLDKLAKQGVIAKQQGKVCKINNFQKGQTTVPALRKMAYLTYLPYAALDENSFYWSVLQLLSQLCKDHNWALDIFSMSDNCWFERYSAYDYAVTFTNNGSRSNYSMQDFKRLQSIKPLIMLDNSGDTEYQYSVNPDHCASAALAVRHLIANGRKNIGFFCTRMAYTPLFEPFAERKNGFIQAMNEANLPVSEKNFCSLTIRNLNFLRDEIRQNKHLLHEFDAIFAVTDLLAVLLMEVAIEEKIKVPETLSIIGYDGWRPAQYISPRITTVRQPTREIALSAFKLAMQLVNGEKLPPQLDIRLPGTLIPGETVIYKS